MLQQYRNLREEKLKDAAKSTQTTAMLVITSLQKRLLSSIEAFARTLKVHRTGMEKQAANRPSIHQASLPLLFESPGADDERAEFSEEEVIAEEDAQMVAAK